MKGSAWSQYFPNCRVCHTTLIEHRAHGLCRRHYDEYFKQCRASGKTTPDEFVKSYHEPKQPIARPEPTVKRGVKVVVPKWHVEGVCLTDPYQWPLGERPVCVAVDIQGVAGRIEGVPLSMVVVA